MLMRDILNFARSLRKTSIEVYEWQESDVQKPRLSNSPDFFKLTTKMPNLSFSGWDLAHAVVKADYLDRRNLVMPGLGFLLQASDIIDFSKSPIGLKAGTSESMNDISLTSISGRVGQALAILYGQQHLGLKFTAHLRSHVESQPPGSPCLKHKGKAMADFIFADSVNTVLIESKSSFSLKDNDPTVIKHILKGALRRQVDPWMNYLNPSPSNGYVLYSCLREDSWAPSAISVVDPSGDDTDSVDIPFSCEQVIRENYGAWLRVIGLPQAAERLIHQHDAGSAEEIEKQITPIELLAFGYDDRWFALPTGYYYDWLEYGYPFDDFVAVFGIDLFVLKAISKVIENPNLMLTELLAELPTQMEVPQETASIFPDGSFFGLISPQRDWQTEVVRL